MCLAFTIVTLLQAAASAVQSTEELDVERVRKTATAVLIATTSMKCDDYAAVTSPNDLANFKSSVHELLKAGRSTAERQAFSNVVFGEGYSLKQIFEWDGGELYAKMHEAALAKLRRDKDVMKVFESSSFQLRDVGIKGDLATVTYVVQFTNLDGKAYHREDKFEMIRERGKWWARVPEGSFKAIAATAEKLK